MPSWSGPICPKTVDTYRSSLMRKLDIHDVGGLAKFEIRRDLVDLRPQGCAEAQFAPPCCFPNGNLTYFCW